MKVHRNKSLLATLLRVLSSPGGRLSIDYISLTPLERTELEDEHGIVFSTGLDGRYNHGYMRLESWDIKGSVPVRIEAQDKHSRARRTVEGAGNERTR